MRITLAYPIEGLGDPDETVDIDDVSGRRLIGDGMARAEEVRSPKPSRDSAATHDKEADNGRR